MQAEPADYGLTADQLKAKYGAAGHPVYTRSVHWLSELLSESLPAIADANRYWECVATQLKHEAFMADIRASMQPEAVSRLADAIEPPSRLDSTGVVAVDHEYFWKPMKSCPRGCKVQLLGQSHVAVYGVWNGSDTWWKGWAPLPKINKDLLK